MKKTIFKGFTLSEVLITLTIIGLTAMLTIPALIQKQRGKEAAAALQKTYSTLSQALITSTIENGDYGDWTITSGGKNGKELYDWYKVMIKPYVKVIKDSYSDWDASFVLSDGTNILIDDYGSSQVISSCGVETSIPLVILLAVRVHGLQNKPFCFIFTRETGKGLIPCGRDVENCPQQHSTCTAKVLREGAVNY